MRKVWRAVIILSLFACLVQGAAAQEDGLSMTVLPGFDGYCRESSWCPVLVLLTNEGSDVEGELRIRLPEQQITTGAIEDTYLQAITLPAHSRKAYFLYIPFPDHALRFNVQLVERQRLLASQAVALRTLEETDRLYAVVSSSPSDFNFLADVTSGGGDAIVSHLDLDWLPAESIGWEAVDALILNDVDTSTLSPGQREALGTWLDHGGHLVAGGGAGAARTAVGISDLLPVTIGGLETLDALGALGEATGAPVSPGPYPVVETTLQSGDSLIEQDGLSLLARRSFGAGTVDFLAFDAGLDPFVHAGDQGAFWRTALRITARDAQHLTIHNSHNAQRAIASIPGLKAPSIIQIMAFLLAYTILVGPINYLVLRKLKRREWAWLTIPAIVLGFSACAYATGFQVRGRTPIIHRLGVVYTPENAGEGYATELVGLFSPRRTTYELGVEEGSIGRIGGDSNMYSYSNEIDPPAMEIVREAQTTTITDFRTNVGELYGFRANGYVGSPTPESDLEIAIRPNGYADISGSLRNGPVTLEDAMIVFGQNRVMLEDLAPGQLVTSFGQVETVSRSGSLYPDAGITPWVWESDVETARRQYLAEAFFPSDQSHIPSGIYLVGWSDTTPLGANLVDGNARTSDLTLYVFELSAEQRDPEASTIIPASLINRTLEGSTGYVDTGDGRIYLNSGSTATFRFTVWTGITIEQVSEMTLKLSPPDYGTSDVPQVSLWNWETKEWDAQSVVMGENVIPNAGAYFDHESGVRVKITSSATQYVELADLNISLRGRQ